ncbi:MAG TPA: arabinofuranosidase catalytic domain-containing protein [Acidimicrobiales bacterium]|nr:arabinofuranosidase catalytic domain-containing protein [Acidimicrobiales bacterium]
MTVFPTLITLLTLGCPIAVAQAKDPATVQLMQRPEASSQLPCNIYAAAGTPCVAALSTVRALYASYDGPLYRVKRASDGATRNVGVLAVGGYADANTETTFCLGTACTITEIYDQSPEGNNLYVEGAGGNGPADLPAPANALPVTAGGGEVYGVEISAGMGYRNDRTRGVPVGDEPQGIYMVTSATHVNGKCCFDFGNAEINNDDNGNGHMDALNFSTECWFTCNGSGPWAQADLENGLFQSDTGGSQGPQEQGLGPLPFVTAMLMNNGRNFFSLEEGNAQSGRLSLEYAGPEPFADGSGYSPMQQEGAIVLGTGGDDTNVSEGSFFEGVITAGIPPASANEAVQDDIVSVGYGEPTGSVGTLAPGAEVSLRATGPSSNEEYVRTGTYENDEAVIAPVGPTSSARAASDATWVVQPGLAKSSCVSFEALSNPGAYLESQDFALYVSPDDGSPTFARNATFCPRAVGVARGTVFQSYAHPGMYIRHWGQQLYVASDGGSGGWDTFLEWSIDTGWAVTIPWAAAGYHELLVRNDGLCVGAPPGNSADEPVVQEICGSSGQKGTEAELVPLSGGYGEIMLQASGEDIAVAGRSDATGVPDVVLEPPSASAASLWLPVAQPGGSLKFMNADSGLCLGVYGDASGPGRRLDQSTCSSLPGAAWQTFDFK